MTVSQQFGHPIAPAGAFLDESIHSIHEFLHDFLLAHARRTPDGPAVVESPEPGRTTVTTYAELDSLAHAYADRLDTLGVEIGSRVILEAEPTAASIAALIACSRAGLTFVPVSPETPPERLLSIVESARPAVHLQPADGTREGLPPWVATGRFSPEGLSFDHRPAQQPRRRRTACVTDPAYIIFTSGTTGRPKGVVMSHRAVTAFYRGMLTQAIATPQDRVANTSPLHFDFSLLNIGLALGSGAAVVPIPQALMRWPRHFLRVLRDTGATQVNGVPSIWRQALRYEPDRLAALDGLRSVLYCGEEFPLPELRRLRELRPGVRIVNCYGSTESMACSFEDVPDPLPDSVERLSIGVAHPGAEMLLVDAAGEVVDRPGTPGEIHLRGPALFSGYWDDPAATRAALVPDPLCPESGQRVLRTGDLAVRGEGGEFYFSGRTDAQVQINGNRVELGEVERRLLEFPGAVAAAALPLPAPGGGLRLAAFVVLSAGRFPDGGPGEVREFCGRTLPGYMVPQEVRFLDVLPTTPNGKVDRAALADTDGGARRTHA
ncbi:AMP-binding protein [Streptomyces sp. NBC_01485]|uniref:AMP-binding protein n=1 Tax=Streptomyces sp. NBC_01485 TaxID=2903884 RepID=UPI002E340CE8|nr:AMP-binding protein [Streptomyces sp. NBC_01485]